MALSTCVYIIEDDEAVAGSLVALLGLCGHRASRFAAADLFLAEVESLPPGCLLIDYALPGASGLDALRALRDRGIDWPAILMTGHETEDLEVEAERLGVRSVLAKPFHFDLLTGTLEGACRLLPKPPTRPARRVRRPAIASRGTRVPVAVQGQRPTGNPIGAAD